MFENLLRELRRLDGTHRIAVSLSSDGEGYLDRECPSPECEVQFKVHEDDWRDKVRDEEVFCAFCGHAAASDQWWTQQQLERAKKDSRRAVRAPYRRCNEARRPELERRAVAQQLHQNDDEGG